MLRSFIVSLGILCAFNTTAQYDSFTYYHRGDHITQYSSDTCSFDSSSRTGNTRHYCKDGVKVKEWMSGCHIDVRNKLWVSRDENDIWFSSNFGIYHFDRVKDEWRGFNVASGELTHDFTHHVGGDSNNNVWFTYTFDKGLGRIKDNKVHTYTKSNSNIGSDKIGSFGTDKNGIFYVSTGAGLMKYDPAGDSFIYVNNHYGNVMAIAGDTVFLGFEMSSAVRISYYSPGGANYSRINSLRNIKSGDITDLVIYPNRDTILMATKSLGLFNLDTLLNLRQNIQNRLISTQIYHAQLLADDSIWVNYTLGYTKFHRSEWTNMVHTNNSHYNGKDYYVNDSQQVWILGKDLLLVKDSSIAFSNFSTRGSDFQFQSGYRRANGDIVGCHREKHFVFSKNRWRQFGEGKYASPPIGKILEMPNHEFWLVVEYIWKGYPQIFVYDSSYKLLRTYDDNHTGVTTGTIRDAIRNVHGEVFIATPSGLIEYHPTSDDFSLHTSSNSGLYFDAVYALASDLNGWVYISNGKLSRYDGTEIITIAENTGHQALSVNRRNELWSVQVNSPFPPQRTELSVFKRVASKHYVQHHLDTLDFYSNQPTLHVDHDNVPNLAFEDKFYRYEDDEFIEIPLVVPNPGVQDMNINGASRLFASEKGIIDYNVDYKDQLERYDSYSFYLEGHVFYDRNQNDFFDGKDQHLGMRKLLILPDSIYFYTDANGEFSVRLDSARHGDSIVIVHFNDDGLYYGTRDTQLLVLGQNNERLFYRDFPCTLKSSVIATELSILIEKTECAKGAYLMVNLLNRGTSADRGSLDVWLDDMVSSTEVPSGHEQTQVQLGAQEYHTNYISLYISNNKDSTVKIKARWTSDVSSEMLEDSLEFVISCNQLDLSKTNTPLGLGGLHGIFVPDTLSYHIALTSAKDTGITSFVLRDTLDPGLLHETFKLRDISHNARVQRVDSILTIEVDDFNVQLGRDTPVNKLFWLRYDIATRPDLTPGTYIYNRVSSSVVKTTNRDTLNSDRVFNLVIDSSHLSIPVWNRYRSIQVYPNPSSAVFNIRADWPIQTIVVFDAFGKRCYEFQLPSASKQEVDLSHLRDGIYFIQVENGNRKSVVKATLIK